MKELPGHPSPEAEADRANLVVRDAPLEPVDAGAQVANQPTGRSGSQGCGRRRRVRKRIGPTFRGEEVDAERAVAGVGEAADKVVEVRSEPRFSWMISTAALGVAAVDHAAFSSPAGPAKRTVCDRAEAARVVEVEVEGACAEVVVVVPAP